MNKIGLVIPLLTLALSSSSILSSPALAQPKHEITGGTNSTLSFSSDSTSFGFTLGYFYYLLPTFGIQVGYSGDLSYLSANDAHVTVWSNMFKGRFNIPTTSDLLSRFFVDGGLGFALRSNSVGVISNTNTKFAFELGAGKRFRISDNVAYVPAFSIRKLDDESVRFNFTILAISIFL